MAWFDRAYREMEQYENSALLALSHFDLDDDGSSRRIKDVRNISFRVLVRSTFDGYSMPETEKIKCQSESIAKINRVWTGFTILLSIVLIFMQILASRKGSRYTHQERVVEKDNPISDKGETAEQNDLWNRIDSKHGKESHDITYFWWRNWIYTL